MNIQCKQYLFRTTRAIDQFGILYRPVIKQGQKEFKTVLGGLCSIIIYGLSLAYFIYGIQQWATYQILPTITEFNEVIDIIQYQSQRKMLLIKPLIQGDKQDPFDKNNIILMLVTSSFSQDTQSNATRIKQFDSQFVVENLQLSINNINQTSQEQILYFTSCQQELLEKDEQCASSQIIQQFWNASNMMEIQLFSQRFNPQQRKLQYLMRQYFILYDEISTYYNDLLIQTTITNIDQGIIFPSIHSEQFVSDIIQNSQTIAIQQFIKQFGVQVYLAINLRMDIQQKQQKIAYPNQSQVLANIGSIISTLLLFSYIVILLNQRILEEESKLEIIKIFFPEFDQITINKNWYGRIVSILNQETNEFYNLKQFLQYFNRLKDIAEQKLCITNQIYEMSRMQFAIQQLLSKSEIMKLRVRYLQLSIKPEIQYNRGQGLQLESPRFKDLRSIKMLPTLKKIIFKINRMKNNLRKIIKFRIIRIRINRNKINPHAKFSQKSMRLILIYSVRIENNQNYFDYNFNKILIIYLFMNRQTIKCIKFRFIQQLRLLLLHDRKGLFNIYKDVMNHLKSMIKPNKQINEIHRLILIKDYQNTYIIRSSLNYLFKYEETIKMSQKAIELNTQDFKAFENKSLQNQQRKQFSLQII